MLESRRSEVLRALVEEHIRTGEPVSSRAIVERARLNVSSATVRHDLAGLEEEGYAAQPHTSAGRIPTVAAYRYYVDHLGPVRLRAAAQAKISAFFGDVQLELSKLLKATSELLAEITDLPSVVVAPRVVGERIRSLHTVLINPEQILVIAVTEAGRVLQQRRAVRAAVTPRELEDAHRAVASSVVGTELGNEINPSGATLDTIDQPRREAALAMRDAIRLMGSEGAEMFVGGTERLTSVWEDLTAVHRILEVLEREAEMMKILAGVSGTSIQIGSELPMSGMDMAVVSKSYEVGSSGGSVGVIGPMRMNYKRAITAVEEISRELEDRIGSGRD